MFAMQGDTIYLIDADGGPLSTLIDSDFHDLRGIMFDDGALYVVDQFGESGRILRVDLTAVPAPASIPLVLLGLLLLKLTRGRRRGPARTA